MLSVRIRNMCEFMKASLTFRNIKEYENLINSGFIISTDFNSVNKNICGSYIAILQLLSGFSVLETQFCKSENINDATSNLYINKNIYLNYEIKICND